MRSQPTTWQPGFGSSRAFAGSEYRAGPHFALGRLVLLGALAITTAGAAATPPAPVVADFQFLQDLREGAGLGARAVVSNATFTARGLLLNRGYESAGAGYQAQFVVPHLDLHSCAFVVDLKPLSFSPGTTQPGLIRQFWQWLHERIGRPLPNPGDSGNVITAGKLYRWLGFNHGPGHLQLTLNNQQFLYDFTNIVLATHQWHRLGCSLDLTQRQVHVVVDGRLLEAVQVPPQTALGLTDTAERVNERDLTLANYSNGQTFHGYVRRLTVYGSALPPEHLQLAVTSDPLPTEPLSSFRSGRVLALGLLFVLLGGRVAWRHPRPGLRHRPSAPATGPRRGPGGR